jgi:hypothetical protein
LLGIIFTSCFNNTFVLLWSLNTSSEENIATKIALNISKGKWTPTKTRDNPLIKLSTHKIVPMTLVVLLNNNIIDIEKIKVV